MTYAAFFRGINVGGKNVVKMAELRQMLFGLDYQNVKTYIQSGNAVFDAEGTADSIRGDISAAFCNAFGFESTVLLRTKDEIGAVIEGLPFSEAERVAVVTASPGLEHLYYYFSDDGFSLVPDAAYLADGTADRLVVGPDGAYRLCQGSVRDSKPALALAKRKSALTARNWKTLTNIMAMM